MVEIWHIVYITTIKRIKTEYDRSSDMHMELFNKVLMQDVKCEIEQPKAQLRK